jgi:hypothetical protein
MNFRHCALWLLAFTFSLPLAAQTASKADPVETRLAERDLWVGHVTWVRNVVTAKLSQDAKAEAAAEKQVVANAKAIAGSIEPFYGKAASDKLFDLLAGHYGAIKSYLDATAAGQSTGQQTAEGMRKHIYVLSDALVGAIAKQFPDRFKASAT